MYYSGYADEAGQSIEEQIKATKELGWSFIEARGINGVNITDITDVEFEVLQSKLYGSGVGINCFGSAIANHGRDPRKEDDFQYSVDALKRAIPRMQSLGTKMIRCMAFKEIRDTAPDSAEIEKLVFDKVNYLAKVCEDAGIIFLCENCSDYSGLSHEHTLRLLDKVKSPALKLVYDMGNTIGAANRVGEAPYKLQDAWEFYSNIKEFIYHVHIKDAVLEAETNAKKHTFPGEGSGYVKRIVEDLLYNGYDGGLTIEPHMGNSYDGYIEYGRRLMKLVDEVKTKQK